MFSRIDGLKAELGKCHSLTPGEVQRLKDEFLVEYTYNSNTIEGNTLTLQETALVLDGKARGLWDLLPDSCTDNGCIPHAARAISGAGAGGGIRCRVFK